MSAKIGETRGEACKVLGSLIFTDMVSVPRKFARRYLNRCMCVQVCSLYSKKQINTLQVCCILHCQEFRRYSLQVGGDKFSFERYSQVQP